MKMYMKLLEKKKAKEIFRGYCSIGGQTPLKLSDYLNKMNIPILGTSTESIDTAEDRENLKNF